MFSSRATLAVAVTTLVLLSGCFGFVGGPGTPGTLEEDWISDTERDIQGNHHAVAAARIDGKPMVFAPVSGHANSEETAGDGHQHSHANGCALLGLNGTTGAVRWTNPTTERACTIHAVADPVVADVDGDGDQEVVAATTEERVTITDPKTGFLQSTAKLSAYGFTRPLVDDFLAGEEANASNKSNASSESGDSNKSTRAEVAVVDVRGQVVVLRGSTEVWSHQLAGDVQAQPRAADLDDDPQRELVVGTIDGSVVALDPGEGVRWNRTLEDASVTWLTVGQADADPRTEVVAATYEGEVVLLDDDGSVRWSRDVGKLAAVDAFTDGDGDGEAEVYATNKTGVVWTIGPDGDVEWTRDVVGNKAGENYQMTPPPVVGDVTGDGSPELVIADNAGGVTVLDPRTGEVLATYSRDVSVWTHPTVADLDDDGADEILVMYGDGRVVKLSYESND